MVRIITDTTAVLPQTMAERYHIGVAPQIIVFGDKEFKEMVELSYTEFMEKLKTSPELPKTAAPAPQDIEELYRPIVEAGDTILSIHPSSSLSGTVRSATIAARSFPDADIRVIDTQSIAGPLARLVLAAAKWAEAGLAIDEIEQRIQALMSRQRIYFLVATLDYLQRGGRIGGAAAFIGSILQFKPILTLENGQVTPVERQRTMKKAVARLKELVAQQSARGDEARLTVMHSEAPELAENLVADLSQTLGTQDVITMNLAPAIVTHAGPGAVAVGFFTPEATA